MKRKIVLWFAVLLAVAPVSKAIASTPASSDCSHAFVSRLAAAYREDAQPADPNAPARRAMPSPLDSLPFPSAEWQLGGVAYPIGVPNLNSQYPLEKALACTALGNWMQRNRLEIYGWINPSANVSTSNNSNYPLSYAVRPNRVEFAQALLRVERVPDTVQTDHVDWGMHIDVLYGYDYHFTTAKGVFSNQLLNNPKPNQPLNGKIYGVDPMLFFGDIYLPHVAEGMVIRIGRWLSLPDIEAQYSPNNYLVTHSILYIVNYLNFELSGHTMMSFRNEWYKCTRQGQVAYQETPCDAGAQQVAQQQTHSGDFVGCWITPDNRSRYTNVWRIESIGAGLFRRTAPQGSMGYIGSSS